MATILLSAVGYAAGSALGGSVLGLSSAIIGRAVGATIGRVIDQRLMGQGSEVIETGRVDRFRLTGASEGAPVAQIWGRARVGGQVIWASDFQEEVTTSGGGGKGAPSQPKTKEYSYTISLAIALCEGQISRVGRIWADGNEIAPQDLQMRVYKGTDAQLPDAKIEAVEGPGNAPAYRGVAYVVIEDLDLGLFGNRVPQFSFEVVRPVDGDAEPHDARSLSRIVQGVALMPGTGEYTLATTPVHYDLGQGETQTANMHTPSGQSDFATSLEVLDGELPRCGSVSLIVSWFGDDLRCGECALKPKVEQVHTDGADMPWQVSGVTRAGAEEVPKVEGRSVYGGTPTDQSVIESIQAMQAKGRRVMFYPFILMEQLQGNGLQNPYTRAFEQPHLPWRGRITTSFAPGVEGSPDGTGAAEDQVAAFMGTASVSDFQPVGQTVGYTGPQEWSYRRFILHYAHLCALAGGVEAFCIGSEMRGLTQIRGAGGSFPAVEALKTLAAEVRGILGPATKITYAADWSEYFGYHPQDGSGDVYFHLDPLWADPNIDMIGIDNYMPLSDWRDGYDHADAEHGAIYNLDYLAGNVAGGEGFDWYYAHGQARDAQIRTPIADGAHGEPWVFRYKDLKSWWLNRHHNRVGGVRQAAATAWEPQSKPFWFTELGCAAIDKGTNQPNKFLDPKSSESQLPHYSRGTRDDLMQAQYLRAIDLHFRQAKNNPVSEIYEAPMVDMANAHVWAWDARPYPYFPTMLEVWSDGENYARGHWLNGRASAEALAAVISEVAARSGVRGLDLSRLWGLVRGYGLDDIQSARAAMQPLMLAYGFDAVEREGALTFRTRTGQVSEGLDTERFALSEELEGPLETERAPAAEIAGRVRLNFVEADGDYEMRAAEAIFPDEVSRAVSQSEVPLVLTQAEGQGIVERWLSEARVARDTARFVLPPSALHLGAGDVVQLPDDAGGARFRIDRVEQGAGQTIEAVRVEPEVLTPSDAVRERVVPRSFVAPAPVYPLFLDLPLLTGEEVPHAPHIAVTARPWPGSVAVYGSPNEAGFELNRVIETRAVIGRTLDPMPAARPGEWDRGPEVRVKLVSGTLASVSPADVLNGANAMAIGDGSPDGWEVFQFSEAELVDKRTYALRMRLRGQAGTDGVIPPIWPVGSEVVLLDARVQQISLPSSARGLARHYRIGPASRSLEHASYVAKLEAFDGVGLRPYAPAHLRAGKDAGDWRITWVRRTRVDGDSWASVEVPLGEAQEMYLLRVSDASGLLREETVTAPSWTYSAAAQASDGGSGPLVIEVAQVSERFGPGLFGRIEIDD